MILVSDIREVDSYSVTSEATGYPFLNALDYEKPWLKWRSSSTAAQTITLNFSGEINCMAIFGANFETIEIAGAGGTLGYMRPFGEYRRLFPFYSTSNSKTFVIPTQTPTDGEDYFTLGAIIIGNYVTLTRRPYYPLNKQLIMPVSEITLESGLPKKIAKGNCYHSISLNRRAMNVTQLNEFRDVMRTRGKVDPFVLYENLGEIEKVFLVRRISDFSYSEEGYHDFQDSIILEAIT